MAAISRESRNPSVLHPRQDVDQYLDDPGLETPTKSGAIMRRALWAHVPLALVLALLMSRLWQLQIKESSLHQEQARLNRIRSIPIPPPAG